MGVYTCTKPANFAGVKYMPGDIVPAEAIPADRVGAVIRLGLIAEAQQPAPEPPQQPPEPVEPTPPAPFTVQVKAEDGTIHDIDMTPEAVVELVAVLQMNVEDAADRIETITDDAALIVIDACDSRKTVKKAAAARAAALAGEPGTEEPPADTGTGEPPEGTEPPADAEGS